MAQNFIECDREQAFLLPPSLRDWLPEDHLAWCVLDAVAELDLAAFYADYRSDGWGGAAHDPAMMVALVLYAYAIGERSSRGIERRCSDNLAFRVITANQVPDHATVARFRVRHQDALAGLFCGILALCARAGLVRVGVIALDGTKIHANASGRANRSYEQIAREILEEADALDAAEDAHWGERRGDELGPELADRRTRRERLAHARRELEAEQAERAPAHSRPQRLREAKRRLEEDWQLERAAHAEHEAWRARRGAERAAQGRAMLGRPPGPSAPPAAPRATVNLTDPDSRPVKTPRGFIQGFNAQAICTPGQVVIAADVRTGSPDAGLLEPMVDLARRQLLEAGVEERPDVVLADAGYWSAPQIRALGAAGQRVLVPPDGHARRAPRPGRRDGPYRAMREQLASAPGTALYRRRQAMIEPIFAQTKVTRRADRFQRRGLVACRAEWKLITATHNLLKLWRASAAAA